MGDVVPFRGAQERTQLVDARELAAHMGVCEGTVRRWRRKGMPSTKQRRGRRLFSIPDCERWLREGCPPADETAKTLPTEPELRAALDQLPQHHRLVLALAVEGDPEAYATSAEFGAAVDDRNRWNSLADLRWRLARGQPCAGLIEELAGAGRAHALAAARSIATGTLEYLALRALAREDRAPHLDDVQVQEIVGKLEADRLIRREDDRLVLSRTALIALAPPRRLPIRRRKRHPPAPPTLEETITSELGPGGTPADVDAVAERVAELIAQRETDDQAGFMTVAQAADFLACSKGRVYALGRSGAIPAYKDGGRLLLKQADLRAYVQAGGAKLPAPKHARRGIASAHEHH